MESLKQWINWKPKGARNGKLSKLPLRHDGKPASSTEPRDWRHYNELDGKHERLGFVFASGDGLTGIDLDDCISESGEISEWAAEILSRCSTYAEVSPSGTGIKLYGKCNRNEKGRKVELPDGGAIEIYDHARFFCFTGQQQEGMPRECEDITEGVAWLEATYFPQRQQPAASWFREPSNSNSPDVVKRAAEYLQHVEPAISGQGGMNQTWRAARLLCCDFDLSVADAMPLMVEYNARCQPPWTPKEIERKLRDAREQPGDFGKLTRENETIHIPPAAELEQAPKEPEPAGLPDWCLEPDGLLGEIIEYNCRGGFFAQRELALAGAIALMSTLTGHCVSDDRGLRTNIYVLGIAPSGSGKERSREVCKEILQEHQTECLCGPERLASSTGLINAVASKPVQLFLLDEISHLLATMGDGSRSPHLYAIAAVLMQMYSSSKGYFAADAYADTTKNKTIYYPHAVVYGTATPAAFWESIDSTSLSDGFLGRVLPFVADYVEPKSPEPVAVPDCGYWTDQHITRAAERDFGGNWWEGMQIDTYRPTPEAAERRDAHRMQVYNRLADETEEQRALWSRCNEKACKLALMHAASRDPDSRQITLRDVEFGVAVANYCTRMTLSGAAEYMARSRSEAHKKELLRIIPRGRKITRTELGRRSKLSRREREEILRDLIELGQVEEVAESTGKGRPAVYYTRP